MQGQFHSMETDKNRTSEFLKPPCWIGLSIKFIVHSYVCIHLLEIISFRGGTLICTYFIIKVLCLGINVRVISTVRKVPFLNFDHFTNVLFTSHWLIGKDQRNGFGEDIAHCTTLTQALKNICYSNPQKRIPVHIREIQSTTNKLIQFRGTNNS